MESSSQVCRTATNKHRMPVTPTEKEGNRHTQEQSPLRISEDDTPVIRKSGKTEEVVDLHG